MQRSIRKLGNLPRFKTVEQTGLSEDNNFRQMVRDSMCFLWPMASIAEDGDDSLHPVQRSSSAAHMSDGEEDDG